MMDEASEDSGSMHSFGPILMHHPEPDEYAIHEGYFDIDGNLVAFTTDALSPRAKSPDLLRALLESLLHDNPGKDAFPLGDLPYPYEPVDIAEWLETLQSPTLYNATLFD